MKSSAISHSNIALIKYWGRSLQFNPELNIPLNDSVSMTKFGLSESVHLQSHTTIEFSNMYKSDIAILDGNILKGRAMERILKIVNRLREYKNIAYKFKMVSKNDFPTQSGLASSAAGFAALIIATADALGFNLTKERLSTYARLGSGSAARSIHGGFVYWHKGTSHETSYAEQICKPKEFEMNAVIAIIHEGRKEVTSDVGHESAQTSIFNKVRIKESQRQAGEIKKAILDNDFNEVGMLAENNCKYMHAVMMTSTPPLFYWAPNTLKIIKSVQRMRENEGLECYFTIDAGPNIHVLCRPEDIYEVQKMLSQINGVKSTIVVEPASDSYVTSKHLF